MLEQLAVFENTQTSTITLYPFQERVVREVHEAIADGSRAITLAAPTGSGKTVMSGQLGCDFVAADLNVVFLVPSTALILQTQRMFRRFGVEAGIIAGGYRENRTANVQVMTYQAAGRRNLSWLDPNVYIFDEAHISGWTNWGRRTLRDLGDRKAILLTATPFRLGKRESFHQISDCLIKAPSTLELIQMGRLARPRYLVAGAVDTEGVKIRQGDFAQGELEALCNVSEVTERALDAREKYAKSRLTLAFCVGKMHAYSVAQAARERGLRAVAVVDEVPQKERQKIYEDFAEHRLDLIASCEALSEGFDVPNVGCILLLRPTKSKAKYIQQTGRGLRPFPGKTDCLVICLSGNVKRHGFIEDVPLEFEDLDESLPGEAPVKTCGLWDKELNAWSPGIGCGFEIHASLTICPHCGYEFPSKDDEKVRFAGEIEELIPRWQMGHYELFCDLLDECFEKSWHPWKAIMEYEAAHPKNYKPSYSWMPLWVKDRELSEEEIGGWISAVARRKGPDVFITWMPRFCPDSESEWAQICRGA